MYQHENSQLTPRLASEAFAAFGICFGALARESVSFAEPAKHHIRFITKQM